MSKYAETFNKEFFVGVFVTLGLFLFVGFVFTLQGFEGIMSDHQEIKVGFNYLGGLKEGQPVLYAGYQVGTVRDISIQTDGSSEIIAHLSIPGDLPVYENTEFYIGTSGLVGDKVVDIVPPEQHGDQVTSNEVLEGNGPVNLARVLGKVQNVFGEDTQTKMRSTVENTVRLTQNLAQFSESLNKLTTKNEKEMNRIIDNVSRGSKQLPAFLANADSAARSIDEIAQNLSALSEENSPEIRKIIQNLNKTSRNFKSFSHTIDESPSTLFWGN